MKRMDYQLRDNHVIECRTLEELSVILIIWIGVINELKRRNYM